MQSTPDLLTLLALLQQPRQLNPNKSVLIDALPVSIYWKDKDGMYLGQNAFAKNVMQNEGILDADSLTIANKTDSDFFDAITAKQFRENDLLIIENPDEIRGPILEKTVTPDNRILPQLSIKQPLFDKNNQVMGIIGCTIPIYKYADFGKKVTSSPDFSSKPIKQVVLELLATKNAASITELSRYLRCVAAWHPTCKMLKKIQSLSDRELQSLCLLSRGCSSKEIGQIFSISPRTVEIFIIKIKEKLELSFKGELSNWLWDLLATI